MEEKEDDTVMLITLGPTNGDAQSRAHLVSLNRLSVGCVITLGTSGDDVSNHRRDVDVGKRNFYPRSRNCSRHMFGLTRTTINIG